MTDGILFGYNVMPSISLCSDDLANKAVNIKYVVKNGLCIGCGVCEAACPNNAIRVFFDYGSGVPKAIVNEKQCSGCKTCLNVCYGYKVDNDLNLRIFGKNPDSIVGNFAGCYIGYANDQELRCSSSSGGVVSALLMYAFKRGLIDGALLTRMNPGNPPRPEAFIATTIDDVLSAQGSKYCPVSFAECLKELDDTKRYAVVGLPCHIYGMRKLAELDPKTRDSISLYLGLLCGGMPSYLGTIYILRNFEMEKKYITKFEYRGGGWPGRLLIQGKEPGPNKQVQICVPYPDYWHDAFRFFFPYRCTLCHDGFNEFSDISFGDAGLPHLLMKDRKGTSLIVTRTKVGEHLILDASQNGSIKANFIEIQDVTRSQPGLIKIKSSALRARINLCKAFGRRALPTFDSNRSPSPRLDGYLSGIGLYLGRAIASKRALWSMLDIYTSTNILLNIGRNYVAKMKSDLEKRILGVRPTCSE